MKLIFPLSLAIAGGPAPEPAPPATESAIEEAAQMNERLATILARVEGIKSTEDVASAPVQRTKEGEPAPPASPPKSPADPAE